MRSQSLKSVADGRPNPLNLPASQVLALRGHVMQLHAVPVLAPLPPEEVVIGRVRVMSRSGHFLTEIFR